jgi:hypothetical protein
MMRRCAMTTSIATATGLRKSAEIALRAMPLLIFMALVGADGVASAQPVHHSFFMPGAACLPDNQAYSYLRNIQGIYNNSNDTQIWICPITKLPFDITVGPLTSVTVVQSHFTQDIRCRLEATTSEGELLQSDVRSTAGLEGVVDINLPKFKLNIPGAHAAAYAIRCEIPGKFNQHTSGILYYFVDVNP